MYTELINKCREIIKCDNARISKPGDRMFFIIGFNRNTKDDAGQFYKNGEPYDFDYVSETVIASGYADDELIENVKEYQRLCGTTNVKNGKPNRTYNNRLIADGKGYNEAYKLIKTKNDDNNKVEGL